MHYETYFHDREKLYNEVWDEPVTTVAKRYGVSDVAIHKLCRRLEIPMPSPGYWSKVKAGQKMTKPDLPELSDRSKILGRRRVLDRNDILITDRLAETGRLLSSDQSLADFCAKVRVKERLVNPHTLVASVADYVKKHKGDSRDSYIRTDSSEFLDMYISRNQIERALRIYDALTRNLEELGFIVLVGTSSKNKWGSAESGTFVKIDGEKLKIKLVESTKRIEHIQTEADKSPYAYVPPYDYVPSGVLTLQIDDHWASRKNWSDGKRRKLEQQLGDFIIALVKTAEETKVRRAIWAEEEQRRRDEEKRRLELQELRERETKRFQALEKAADEWHRAQKIKRYIEAVKTKVEKENMDIKQKEQLEEWIRWAQDKADWLNPLVDKEDPIFGKR